MHEYRITVVDDVGRRSHFEPTGDLGYAKELLVYAQGKYADEFTDVFIERRELNPWLRYEPVVPLNQPSLPL